MHDVLHMAQPVIYEAELKVLHRSLHAATTVVTAHNYVTDPEHIHRELKHREAVKVSVDHYVRNVAVDEQLARPETDELSGRHATVRTTDPQVARVLLLRYGLEKSRVVGLYTLRPGPVVFKEFS